MKLVQATGESLHAPRANADPVLPSNDASRLLDPADAEAWDAFVASGQAGSVVQTSAWAAAKRRLGFDSVVVLDRDGPTILGGAQLIIRRFGPLAALGYIPNGPLPANADEQSVDSCMAAVERAARAAGVTVLIVQPPEGGKAAEAALASRGYRTGAPAIAPTATVRLDLGQDMDRLIAGMGRTRRRHMRGFADDPQLRLRLGDAADIPLFAALHAVTASRQGFRPRSVDYLRAHWDELAPRGWVRLLLAEVADEPVAGAWLTCFGDSVVHRLTGWNGSGRSAHPNEACHWGAIRWAKSNGYRYYDLGGIDRTIAEGLVAGEPFPESQRHSPADFKHQFGGEVVLLPLPRLKVLQPLAGPLVHAGLRLLDKSRWAARLMAMLRAG